MNIIIFRNIIGCVQFLTMNIGDGSIVNKLMWVPCPFNKYVNMLSYVGG